MLRRLPVIACWMLIIGVTNGSSLKSKIPKNPEAYMNISQMISYWNYPNEQYDIVTKDGYILDLYRIPHGKGGSEGTGVPQSIVWLHNGRCQPGEWRCGGRGSALCILLPVSLPTNIHLWKSRCCSQDLPPASCLSFFGSFDEMAKYDLPATIDFIVKKTGQEQLYYVGHSQGTTIGFILFSIDPKLAQRIKMFFGLAPVVFLKGSKNPPTKIYPFLEAVVKAVLCEKRILPHTKFNRFLGTKICSLQIFRWLCEKIFLDFISDDYRNLNMSRLDVFLSNLPGGTSIQNIVHWGQIVTSGHLQAFDWKKPALNMAHYNQVTPPLYNVTLMRTPTALWSGGTDVVADPTDVDSLLSILPNLVYHKRIPHYTHLDFCFGVDSHLLIFYEILDMIKKNMQT
uniref:Lipase n=1 Tax=Monodelphis domestica TaxID=13616 RepID=F7E7P9_MONDO